MILTSQERGVAQVKISRPEVHNAFDAQTISELTQTFKKLGGNPDVRVIVLSGEGKNFCAGADLNWMKKSVQFTKKQNQQDALKMHHMLQTIYNCAKPTLAQVQGIAFGGGVGLASVVDVAVSASDAVFALSEVKLGILPAVISPFVIRKIGVAAFRAYGLSAKRLSADEALRIGLVQEVASPDALDVAVAKWIDLFLANAPGAMSEVKSLTEKIRGGSLASAAKITTRTIAKARAGKEGQEGMKSFFEKRKPNWVS